MVSLEIWSILTTLQKLPKNGEDWKSIVAKGFKRFPKVQNIAQSGHTGRHVNEAGKGGVARVQSCFEHLLINLN